MDISDLISKMFPNVNDIDFLKELMKLLEKYNMSERTGIKEYIIASYLYATIGALKTLTESLNYEKESSHLNIDKLNESILEANKFIQEKGLESILKIKLVLTNDMIKELKKTYHSYYYQNANNINMYMGVPFEIGNKISVEIVKKEIENGKSESKD